MDPSEEKREMKKNKEYMTYLGYVADSEYGIPTRFLCGGRILHEIRGKEEFDTLPGKRYFTCKNYKDDGFHYRQPWVFGIQEEIERLIKQVDEAEEVIKGIPFLESQIQSLMAQVGMLNGQVDILNVQVSHLETLCFD